MHDCASLGRRLSCCCARRALFEFPKASYFSLELERQSEEGLAGAEVVSVRVVEVADCQAAGSGDAAPQVKSELAGGV